MARVDPAAAADGLQGPTEGQGPSGRKLHGAAGASAFAGDGRVYGAGAFGADGGLDLILDARALPLDASLRSVLAGKAPVDKKTIGTVQEVAYQSGAMVRVSGPNIILSPPLVLTADDVQTILGALDAGFAAVSG